MSAKRRTRKINRKNVDMPATKFSPPKGSLEYRVQQLRKELSKKATKFSNFIYTTVGVDGFLYELLSVNPYSEFSMEKAKAFFSLRKTTSDARRKFPEFWPSKAHGKGLPLKHLRAFNSRKVPLTIEITKRVPITFKQPDLDALKNTISGLPKHIEEMKKTFDQKLKAQGVDSEARTIVLERVFNNVSFEIIPYDGGYRRGRSLYIEITATMKETPKEIQERLARVAALKQLISKVEKEDKEIETLAGKLRKEQYLKEQREYVEKQKQREKEQKKAEVKQRKLSAKQKLDEATRQAAVNAVMDKLSRLNGKQLKDVVSKVVEIVDSTEQADV